MAQQAPEQSTPVVPPVGTEVPAKAPAPAAAPKGSGDSVEFKTDATDPYLTALLKQTQGDPAVPAAPKEPAKADPKEELADKPTGGLNDLDPKDIENPQVRALGELLIGTVPNIDLERALGKAIAYGNVDLIDDAYLREIGGAKANALLQLSTQIVENVKEQSAGTVKAIYAEAAGEENWKAAVAYFNKNAPEHIKDVAVSLIDSPNHTKIKSGAKFILDFAKQAGALTDAANLIAGAPGGSAVGSPLSKEEFIQELAKVKPEHINPNYAEERGKLYQRRQLGKNQRR